METTASAKSNRLIWLDVIRGMCAIFIVLSHFPSSPLIYKIFYAPIMIPAFFFVSGYLSKNYNGDIKNFLYNRSLKLLIFRFIIITEVKFMSVKLIIKCLTNPKHFINTILEIITDTLLGRSAWFFSCLIIVSLYFIIINTLCRNKSIPMVIVSIAFAVIGILISKEDTIRAWSWDTALVCQLFYVIGYCVKQKQWLSENKIKTRYCILSSILYLGSVVIFAKIFGAENIAIVVANNTWKIIPVTVFLIFTGNLFIICLAQKLIFSKFLAYVGRHSFLYFAFAGQLMLYCRQAVLILYDVTGIQLLNNNLITCIPIVLAACLINLIPCKLSDKFCPALNGTIKLPKLKTKDKNNPIN